MPFVCPGNYYGTLAFYFHSSFRLCFAGSSAYPAPVSCGHYAYCASRKVQHKHFNFCTKVEVIVKVAAIFFWGGGGPSPVRHDIVIMLEAQNSRRSSFNPLTLPLYPGCTADKMVGAWDM